MTEVKSAKKWYVIRSVSGKENKIKEYIESEIVRLNLQDFIEQILVPTEKVVQIRNGKKINKERVFIPGYIMVQADLVGEIPHIIKSVNGVIGFLGEVKGGEPVPLRQAEVNRLLGKVDELSVKDENVNIPYTMGETIKVIDGPFNGFNGTVEKIFEEKRKLEVMVKIFGRKTPLELSFMQVEKV
ncbi:transcription termination/antitermination protein NusG [Flavobacteriaceae bacterium]|mgnify:CR=1 FL=1|nr:transcription termination/antitermination protein NusG [Flavobacteriaceae bacterium]MDB9912678.1 transcription termination/antitermination protein NusG [Flavobacteriaceae bacterium]MDB9994274.1 transcription termination/antitermination protein NusG [Flavobacteriaceae bacterium]|tara:strand:- start:220 stop:774 length:555 start_codon:yes stop_codon:yes gene_type:complete